MRTCQKLRQILVGWFRVPLPHFHESASFIVESLRSREQPALPAVAEDQLFGREAWWVCRAVVWMLSCCSLT